MGLRLESVTLRPYVLLIKSRVSQSEIIPIAFSLNVVFALIASSILARRDLLTFGRDLCLSFFSMLATALSVYLYNDLMDVEIDRLNKLDRPLATGEASKKDARNLITLLGIIGLSSAFIIHFNVFLLMLTYFALALLYSFPPVRLKNKFLLNKATVGIGTAISYLIGGAAVGTVPAPIYLMAAFGLVATVSASTVLDLRDIQGDKIHKVKTLPIVWGPKLTIRFAMVLISLMGVATIVGYSQMGFNIAFPILASSTFAGWIFILYPLFRRWNEPSYVANTVAKRIAPLGFLLQILTVLGAIL